MTLLKIAVRNVLKNRRRSLITVLAIGVGFMAVAMFKGYMPRLLRPAWGGAHA